MKVMVSLPGELLTRIDREARRRRTSRSALLQEAARRELGRPDPDAMDAAVQRSRRRFRQSGRFDSTTLIRAERDSLAERDRRRL